MNRIFTLLALVVVVFCSCEDEWKPTFEGIPELVIDDNWDFKSGDVVSDTIIRLRCFGVKANSSDVEYKILLGTDTENMVECNSLSDTITLKPYNQYFCQVIPYDEASGACGQVSEIYTFYCVPPVVAKTVNGNGEWSTTLDWGVAGDYMQPTTISVTPNIEGYPHEDNIAIKKGQHSYKFKLGNASAPTNAAYTHWWDDSKAIYCEPIIYTYKFTITVAVGDTTFEFPQEVQDVIINTEDVVRDHEFNVYRLAKIGNKVWTIDDYRATTYYTYWNGEYEKKEISVYIDDTNAATYHYPFCFCYNEEEAESAKRNHYPEYKNLSVPEGFHVSTEQDWLDLEALYGVVSDLHFGKDDPWYMEYANFGTWCSASYGQFRPDIYVGSNQHIKAKLSSLYGWETCARNDSVEQSIGAGAIFNAKPSSSYDNDDVENRIVEYRFTYAGYHVSDGPNRFLTSESNGIARVYSVESKIAMTLAVRLVKD